MPDVGPDHPEVGDCYSLLGRTYLVAKNYQEARRAVREAHRLIHPNGSKDHLDLLILSGDLEARTGERETAEAYYTHALELPEAADVQVSEIFARGYFQRGENRRALGLTQSAIEDYERAEAIWEQLEEHEESAKARWSIIVLTHPEEKDLLKGLDHPSPLVRLTAYRRYNEAYPANPKAIAHRIKPPSAVLKQMLREATHEVAIKYQHL